MGMKLAHPEKTVSSSCGDGTYMFNNPTACHFVSQAYDLPANHRLQQRDLALHQGGDAAGYAGWMGGKHGKFSADGALPSPRYEMVVAAHGGYGEMVDDPQQVLPALQRALKVVKEEKRQAVLNVICGSH